MEKYIKIYKDNRGEIKFIDTYKFISINKKNVVRGIHCSPYSKTITCLNGSISDFIIDLKTLKYTNTILNINEQLYIPPNHGHCFLSLENGTSILYNLDGIFDEEKEINIHYNDPYIDLPLYDNYIVSNKDINNKFIKPIDYIVLGKFGFLSTHICKSLNTSNKNFVVLNTRLENLDKLEKQLLLYKPKYLINATGISGKPTVEWCEYNKEETYKINYTLQLDLIKLCDKLNIHITICGSGMIFNNNNINKETDIGNLDSIYYSKIRCLLEKEIKHYKNILYLRMIFPISGDNNSKCFLNKTLTRLNNIHHRKINITTVNLFDILPNIIENNEIGIFNFVNPSPLFISDILSIYKKIVNPDIKWNELKENYLEPLLDTKRLENFYITHINRDISNIKSNISIEKLFTINKKYFQ